jgi:hypothetical protein
VDQLPENVDPADIAKVEFYYPKKESGDTFVGARLLFHEVELMVTWHDTEQGEGDFNRLIQSLPGIVGAAKQQRDIKRETEGLDAELLEFFGDDVE